MTVVFCLIHQDGISTDLDPDLDPDLDLNLDLDVKPGPGSGPGPSLALTLVRILGSSPLSLFLNSFLTQGSWRIIYKKLPCWLKHIRSFFLPSRRLIQVSALHQLLQIFFTFNLSRWCTWVINTIILVAATHVLFWCRNPVIKLSGLRESSRENRERARAQNKRARLKAPRKTLRRTGGRPSVRGEIVKEDAVSTWAWKFDGPSSCCAWWQRASAAGRRVFALLIIHCAHERVRISGNTTFRPQ